MLKRLFDILLSSMGLIGSSPLWLFFSLAVKFEDGGPVFYAQKRMGKNGRIFDALKFRSMIPDAEKKTGAVWASEHDPRVTKVGRILRATAMDELPQLWNIFIGDMSFVGPRAERPELVEQFAQKIKNYRERFSVTPGLTGLAQVYGRYDTPPHQKLRYDLLYIKNQSFLLDLKLIFLSFYITFRGKWESRQKKF
jgi:lipopolysaccharide/colanic/teichoic acid biosynthesis glycosyltransferase